jgi:hypothetical protein
MTELSLQDLQSQLSSLLDEVGSLRTEVTRLNDIQAIRTLHFKYGYYWDNVLYDQVIDLFTDDVKVPILSMSASYSSSTTAVVSTMAKRGLVVFTRD